MLELTSKQTQALTSEAQQIFFVGGVGCGKTALIGLWQYNKMAQMPGSVGLLTAPVYDTLRNATLPRLQASWFKFIGLEEDKHYVINKRPPKSWGVRAYSSLHQTRVITFIDGSYLIIDTADNFNKHRGAEYDYIINDEWRDQRAGSHDVFVSRLRGEKAKANNIKNQILITTTPPNDPDQIEYYTRNREIDSEVIHSTTYDNIKNLPIGYIEMLQTTLDPLTYRREVLGENVRMGNLACWSFSKENIADYEFTTNNPIYLIFDFDYNPQVVLLNQLVGLEQGEPKYCVVKEWIFRPGNTETACKTIITWLRENNFNSSIVTTGDYSGIARTTKSNTTDWNIIERLFSKEKNPSVKWEHESKRRPTTSLRNSLNCLNALFNNFEGLRRQYINPKCEYTLKDIKQGLIGNDGRLEHGISNEKSHAIACLADFAKTIHPIRKDIQWL